MNPIHFSLILHANDNVQMNWLHWITNNKLKSTIVQAEILSRNRWDNWWEIKKQVSSIFFKEIKNQIISNKLKIHINEIHVDENQENLSSQISNINSTDAWNIINNSKN